MKKYELEYIMSYYDRKAQELRKQHDEKGSPAQAVFRKVLETFSSDLKSGPVVLDLGCGTGRYFHTIRNCSVLVGIDLSMNMLLEAKNPVKKELISAEHISLVRGDAFQLPFKSSKFDFVYSIGSLGVVGPFTKVGVNEIARILKPNGIVIFATATVLGHLPIIPPYWKFTRRLILRVLRLIGGAVYIKIPKGLRDRLDGRFNLGGKLLRLRHFSTSRRIKKIVGECGLKLISCKMVSRDYWPLYLAIAMKGSSHS